MNDLFQVTLRDQIEEVEREVRMRESVYPRLVAQKKLTQERADWHLAVMRRVAVTLRELQSN